MNSEIDTLRSRVAELEAPPTVPLGLSVILEQNGDWSLVARGEYGTRLMMRWDRYDGRITCAPIGVPADAAHALLWAVGHNKRPPHAADGEVGK